MSEKKWVAGWGAATTITAQNHTDYFKDQTFRYSFFPTMNATAVRLHFSSRFNTEKSVITKAVIAKTAGKHKIDTSTVKEITFGGKKSLEMAPGGEFVSDEIAFDITAGEEFTVDMYFGELTQLMTGHSNNGYYITKYFAKGDYAGAADIPLEDRGDNGPYVFLGTIDFLCDDDCRAIVAFGDSITAQPWPDCFARRMYNLGIRNRAIIRRGIGGSRILRDYKWRCKKHWGEAGIKRFEHDVTETVGADRVFVLHGVNDLLHPAPESELCPMDEMPTADEIIEGLKKYVEIAHKHGMKIYLATTLPCKRFVGAVGERVEKRMRVNEWIRNESGADGYIEFEGAVIDPADPQNMLPEYNSGDNLHPSLAGAQALADSIPEEYFRN